MTPGPLRTEPPNHNAGLRWALLAGVGALVVGAVLAGVFWPRPAGPAVPAPRPEVNVQAIREQAAALQEQQRFSEAEQVVRRWREERPDDLEAHLRLVDICLRSDRMSGAVEGARSALRLKPDAHDLRQQLAVWLFLLGRNEEAAAECRRCRTARPNEAGLMMLQADIAFRQGELAQAAELVAGALRAQPGLPNALALRGALLLEAGKPEEAIAPLREAVERGGESQLRARHYLGQALARAGQEEEARKVLAEVQRLQTLTQWKKYGQPESVPYKLALAESLLVTGQSAEAERMLKEVLAKAPDTPAAHRLLARHHEAKGQPDKAAEHRRKAGD